MNVRPLAPFGAEVTGIDCADPLIDHAALAQQIASARVAVFRGQRCDDQQFVRFLSGFGPLIFTNGETPVTHAPMLNIVSNVGRDRPPSASFIPIPAISACRHHSLHCGPCCCRSWEEPRCFAIRSRQRRLCRRALRRALLAAWCCTGAVGLTASTTNNGTPCSGGTRLRAKQRFIFQPRHAVWRLRGWSQRRRTGSSRCFTGAVFPPPMFIAIIGALAIF